jgi:hypothetical protein
MKNVHIKQMKIQKENKMTADMAQTDHEHQKSKMMRQSGGGGGVYGLGLVGAWFYYFKSATTNQQRVEGFFKGLVWPAFLVYDLLVFLKKN